MNRRLEDAAVSRPRRGSKILAVLGASHPVAFVGSADLAVSRAFYEGILGLRLIEASEFANAFEANGAELRVTHVALPVQAPYTVLGWRVEDIVASVHGLREAGVAFRRFDELDQDGDDIWTAPGGSRVAWFADPDRNLLSLQQASGP